MPSRDKAVLIRLTEYEKEHLKRQAAITGFKVEPFIRSLIMNSKLRPRPPGEYGEILRELSAIGNNINQIARVANGVGKINWNELDKIQLALNHIWEEVKKM